MTDDEIIDRLQHEQDRGMMCLVAGFTNLPEYQLHDMVHEGKGQTIDEEMRETLIAHFNK